MNFFHLNNGQGCFSRSYTHQPLHRSSRPTASNAALVGTMDVTQDILGNGADRLNDWGLGRQLCERHHRTQQPAKLIVGGCWIANVATDCPLVCRDDPLAVTTDATRCKPLDRHHFGLFGGELIPPSLAGQINKLEMWRVMV